MQPKSIKPGFTIIELIIVILLIAIVAILFIPKFIQFPINENTMTVIADALSSLNKENYKGRSLSISLGTSITNCQDITKLLQQGLPSDYSISSLSISEGSTQSCPLTGPGRKTALFTATGIK